MRSMAGTEHGFVAAGHRGRKRFSHDGGTTGIMDVFVESYLETVERHLKAMPKSERADVLSLIESRVTEMCYFEKLSPREALESIGNPAEVAERHLRAAISETKGPSIGKLRMKLSLRRSSGHSSLIVVPGLSVLSIGLIVAGIAVAVLSLIQAEVFLPGQLIPVLPTLPLNGPLAHLRLPISLILGSLFVTGGVSVWRLMVKYLRTVGVDNQKFN